MRILIADDDPVCRLVLQTSLAGIGEITCSMDGAAAVEEFRNALGRNEPYDLVCLDIMMPNLDGLKALAFMRAEEERTQGIAPVPSRIIMITSDDNKESIATAFQGLCDAYLVKPITHKKLIHLVEVLCQPERCSQD